MVFNEPVQLVQLFDVYRKRETAVIRGCPLFNGHELCLQVRPFIG